MRILKFLLLILVAFLSVDAAFAAERQRSGLSYTTRNPINSQNQTNTNLKRLEYQATESQIPGTQKEVGGEEDATPSSKIWKKYQDLAAGKSVDKKEDKDIAKKEEPEAKTKKNKTKATGIAALIEQYQQNKKNRGSMRSLTITKPKAPEKPQKPKVEKPKAEESAVN